MKQDKCIYCGKSKDFSIEHPLPFGFGEFAGFPVLKNRICKTCNSIIGRIEEQLLRSGTEAFIRKYLGIRGRKKHDKKNIFQTGSSGAKPIDFKAKLPEDEFPVLWEFDDNSNVREARQLLLIGKNGTQKMIRVHDYMLSSEDNFRQSLKRAGIDLSDIKDIHFLY